MFDKEGFYRSFTYHWPALPTQEWLMQSTSLQALRGDDTSWGLFVFFILFVCVFLFTKNLWRTMRKDSVFETMVWKERKGDVRQLDGWGRSWPPGALPFLAESHSQADLFSHCPRSPWRRGPATRAFLRGREAACKRENGPGVFNLGPVQGWGGRPWVTWVQMTEGPLDQAQTFLGPSSYQSDGRDLQSYENTFQILF